jgi:hypothetical protein
MGKCNFENCGRQSFENEDYCILHCKKSTYQDDRYKIGFLESFYSELIDYSVEAIFRNYPEYGSPSKSDVKVYLEGSSTNQDYINRISSFMKDKVVKYDNIIFPDRDSRDYYDYKKMIDRIDGVHFDYCEFYASSLDLKKAQLFFQECIFHDRWYLYNHKLLEMCEMYYIRCALLRKVYPRLLKIMKALTLIIQYFLIAYLKKNLILKT